MGIINDRPNILEPWSFGLDWRGFPIGRSVHLMFNLHGWLLWWQPVMLLALKNAFGFHYNTEKQKKMFLLLSQLHTLRDGVFGLGIMNI